MVTRQHARCRLASVHTSLINYAFVINNIKPEQVHKRADNDNAANYHGVIITDVPKRSKPCYFCDIM